MLLLLVEGKKEVVKRTRTVDELLSRCWWLIHSLAISMLLRRGNTVEPLDNAAGRFRLTIKR